MVELDVIGVEGSESVVVLPNEADMLRDDAFVVMNAADICDLDDWV